MHDDEGGLLLILPIFGQRQHVFLFSFVTRAGSPQQREPITVGP